MKRFLFFFIVFIAILWGVTHHPRFLLLQEAMQYKTADTDLLVDSDSTLGYVLTDNRWISFPLTPNIERIKIVTNAGITKENSTLGTEEYHYTLEYEIRGGQNNEILQQGNYFHLTRLTHYKDPESGQTHTASFYLDPELIPMDGRVMTIDQTDWSSRQQAEQIKIRLVKKDREVTDVLLRIYKIEQNAQVEELYNWQRLSIPKREKQARGNVYPYDFLSNEEKINLINRRWRPIGPLGVPGKDYRVRNLYTIKERNDEPVIENVPPVLPSISPQQVMTFPIPSGGMNLRFSLTPMDPDVETRRQSASFHWYGPTPAQRSKQEVSINKTGETIIESFFGQGLVEIRSEHSIIVTTQQRKEHNWVEWQPEPLFSRATLCDSEEGVSFTLSQVNKGPTPLRITLRAPVRNEPHGEYQIEYELLGSSGSKGIFHFKPLPSMYDRMLLSGLPIPVSDPVTYYWNLPSQVTGIRINSSTSVMVAVATRPSDLSHRVRVPEDYDRISITDTGRQPIWFPLLPDNYRDIFRRQRSTLLRIQQRPQEDDPDLLAGLYKYESLRPSLQWAGRLILLPPDQNPKLRKPDPASIYYPLMQGMNRMNFVDDNKVYVTRPRLLFFRNNEEVAEVLTLLLDGQPYFKTELHGFSGQIQLPTVPIGENRLTLKTKISEGTALFMNHLQLDREGYQLRFGNRLTTKGLQFNYHKINQGKEQLSFTFFSSTVTEQSIIRVHLLGESALVAESPRLDFSLLDRQFEIHPAELPSVKVLNFGKKLIGEGRKFFFPVGSDVPPGNYTLSVELEEGSEGYLILSRITPGTFSTHNLIREQQQQEASNAVRK